MLILAIIIFFSISIIFIKSRAKSEAKLKTSTEENLSNIVAEQNISKETNEIWQIEIPSISLNANISEGTNNETLNEFVGHFTMTTKKEGNIGLAAHNRGYPVNYFADLKNLKEGDEIIYTYGEFSKKYVVIKNIKISEIDWSYLENSNENKITLITCIENEPEYRRCVQAIEKEEN